MKKLKYLKTFESTFRKTIENLPNYSTKIYSSNSWELDLSEDEIELIEDEEDGLCEYTSGTYTNGLLVSKPSINDSAIDTINKYVEERLVDFNGWVSIVLVKEEKNIQSIIDHPSIEIVAYESMGVLSRPKPYKMFCVFLKKNK
jgi:PKD repeat protein